MTWRFSDGTVVELGGNVVGDTLFAQRLRADLALPDIEVQVWPQPFPGVPLERDRVELLHAWLVQESSRPCDRWMMVSMTGQPDEIPSLPEPPPDDDDVPADAIY